MKLFLWKSGTDDGFVFKTEDNKFVLKVIDYFIVNGYYHLIDSIKMTAPPFMIRKDCVKNMIKFKEPAELTIKKMEDDAILTVFRVSSKNDPRAFHHVTYNKVSNVIFCDFDCEGWHFNDKCYHTSAVMAHLGVSPGREPINVKKAFNNKEE